MGKRLPNFLGLGVQKGGTTTLQRMLEQHPSVFLSPRKELHYFSLHYAQGQSWYEHQFCDADEVQLCGDITPYYLFHPHAPARVQALLPHARLIVLLRDPVERALSQYFHAKRLGIELLDIELAFEYEKKRLNLVYEDIYLKKINHTWHQEFSYVARSRYELQLPLWREKYPENQLLVLQSETFFQHPSQTYQEICEFLNLSSHALPKFQVHSNRGSGETELVSSSFKEDLKENLQPTYQWVEENYGIKWN